MDNSTHKLLHQSKSQEWYTPAHYIEAVREVMGAIDLDPASCELANETVKAAQFFNTSDDGLKHSWPGRVFLNPPYGRIGGRSSAAVWSQRLIDQYTAGTTEEAILLVNACPGDKWFMPLFQRPLCFTDHRIRFYNEQGQSSQPTKGNAFVYFGLNVTRFANVFDRFGVIVVPGENGVNQSGGNKKV